MLTAKRIIAFSGPKYSGKDTAASILFKQNYTYPKSFHRNPFAGTHEPPRGVKGICRVAFGFTEEEMENGLLKETILERWPHCMPRQPLMDVANWFRDTYGGDIWVQAWQRHIDPSYGCEVITDHRFPEELEFLKSQGALILYVQRDQAEQSLKGKQASGDSMALNPSEAHYALIKKSASHILDNNNEVHQLQNQVLSLVRNHFGFWNDWTYNTGGINV